MHLFFIKHLWLLSYWKLCDFSSIKSSKINLGPVLPPDSINWLLIQPNLVNTIRCASVKVHLHHFKNIFINELFSQTQQVLKVSPSVKAFLRH